jgi:hypothetical protein
MNLETVSVVSGVVNRVGDMNEGAYGRRPEHRNRVLK